MSDFCYRASQQAEIPEKSGKRRAGPGGLPDTQAMDLEDFLAAGAAAGLASSTLTEYRRVLCRMRRYFGDRSWREIERGDAKAWVTCAVSRGARPNTIRHGAAVARAFWRFLREEGRVRGDPFAGIAPKREHRLPRVISPKEAAALLEACRRGRDRALVAFLLGSGARVGEAVLLEWRAVRLEEEPPWARLPAGKGAERIVPLGRVAARELAALRREGKAGGKVFGGLRPASAWRIVSRAGARAGLPSRVGPHLLRHTCATWLLRGGAGLEVVQAVLGHGSINSTQLYTHLSVGHLIAEHRRCHPR